MICPMLPGLMLPHLQHDLGKVLHPRLWHLAIVMDVFWMFAGYVYIYIYILSIYVHMIIPVVPHKAVAEVSE